MVVLSHSVVLSCCPLHTKEERKAATGFCPLLSHCPHEHFLFVLSLPQFFARQTTENTGLRLGATNVLRNKCVVVVLAASDCWVVLKTEGRGWVRWSSSSSGWGREVREGGGRSLRPEKSVTVNSLFVCLLFVVVVVVVVCVLGGLFFFLSFFLISFGGGGGGGFCC